MFHSPFGPGRSLDPAIVAYHHEPALVPHIRALWRGGHWAKRVKLTAGEGEVWAGKGAVWAGRVEVWAGKGEVCAVDTCDVGDGSSHRMTSSQLTGTPNVGTWSGRR